MRVDVGLCVCVREKKRERERERERRKEELSNLVRALMCCQFGKPEVGQGMERLFDIFGLSWTKKEKRKKERKQSLKIDWKHFCGEDVKNQDQFLKTYKQHQMLNAVSSVPLSP